MLINIKYLQSVIFILIIACSIIYAQTDTLDTVELKSEKVYQGKVTKVTSTTIEFKDALTNLNYEFEKDDIKFVKLSDGTTLTFNERAQLVGEGNAKPAQSQPAEPEAPTEAEEKDNSSMSKIIIIAAGAVVGVLLLGAMIF